MKKGSSIMAAIMLVFITVTIASSIGLTWKWGEGITEKASIQFEIYAMKNSLKAADIYMNTAMDYSVWQALYDTAQRGGFCTVPDESRKIIGSREYASWYNINVQSAEPLNDDEILENIKNCTESNINKYASAGYIFLNYNIIIPLLDMETERNGNSLVFSAFTDNKMTATVSGSAKKISLMRSIDIEKTYETEYFELVDQASDIILGLCDEELDIVQRLNGFFDELDKWPRTLGSSVQGSNPDEIFSSAVEQAGLGSFDSIHDAETHLKEVFSSAISSEISENGYSIKFEPMISDIEITAVNCTPYVDNTGKCDFTYKVDVAAKITITKSGSETFPVYDGEKLSMEPLSFVFLVGKHPIDATVLCGFECTGPAGKDQSERENTILDEVSKIVPSKYNLETHLIRALIWQESRFRHCDPNTGQVLSSTKDAFGLTQLLESTAEDLGVNPCIWEENLEGGIKYLYEMKERYSYKSNDPIEFALAAYNAGPGRTDRIIENSENNDPTWNELESSFPSETQDYVEKVIWCYNEYKSGKESCGA